jgi:5'(3')-deoxyribonucleotidase
MFMPIYKHEEELMIIGLDLDGTTGEYSQTLLEFMAEQAGVEDVEQYKLDMGNPINYAMDNWFANREEFTKAHTSAVDRGLYVKIPVYDKASEILWRLSDEGHDIHIVTSRYVGHSRNGRVTRDTAQWLDDNNIPYRSLHFVKDKFLLKCDVFIDDSPENIAALRAKGREVIVYDAPYNKDVPGRRATNWDEVYAHITEIDAIRSYL